MTNFTHNNIEYKTNESGNRYYKVVDGKTTRIGVAEYQRMLAEYEAEQTRQAQQTEDTKPVKKARKAKKSKNVAATVEFDGVAFTITQRQKDFMLHLPDTDFWQDGLDSCLWVSILMDQIGGEFDGKPMTVGAMISTLREKGLLVVAHDAILDHATGRTVKDRTIALTTAGKAMAAAIGLQ